METLKIIFNTDTLLNINISIMLIIYFLTIIGAIIYNLLRKINIKEKCKIIAIIVAITLVNNLFFFSILDAYAQNIKTQQVNTRIEQKQ